MPPRKAKQNASVSYNDAMPSFPAPPAPSKTGEDARTPEQEPSHVAAGITHAQKQALIDNLQLEITERARKLRAQYALQAQGLRARLEMRVNRIPQALRKRNIQELVDEHTEKANRKPAPPVHVQEKAVVKKQSPRKSLKRQSDQISTDDAADKENQPSQALPSQQQDLANPKKRTKTTTTTTSFTANTKATRTASRKNLLPSTVLSPKSHNSRTLPRSPFKPAAYPPEKQSQFVRPTSPAKPAAPAKVPGTRTASRQTKRTAVPAPSDPEGRSSEASNTSAGTTIVTKTGAKRRPTAGKKPAASAKGVGAAGKKTVASAAKKENVPPPTAPMAGGRSLRKRG